MAAEDSLSDLCPPSRHEKSLGLLTTKFVTLLQEAKDGVLDLKVAADTLAVRQKRRIYDITNVLEGIGLIEKKSKNSIQWKGAGPACNTQEVSDRLEDLREEIADLEEQERRLDTHRSWITQSMSNVSDDIVNAELTYLNHEDVCSCFPNETMLVVQAPPGTQLDVPVPDTTSNRPRRYEISLKSRTSPIYVILVNKETQDSKPTVMEVPPPSSTETDSSTSVSSSGIVKNEGIGENVSLDVEKLARASSSSDATVVDPMTVDAPLQKEVDESRKLEDEEKTKQKRKDKKETDKLAEKPTPPTSPSKITTRAAAIRIQKEIQQQRQQEGRITRQGTKFTASPAEPVDVSPTISLALRKRQIPRKSATPSTKITSASSTTTATSTTSTATTTSMTTTTTTVTVTTTTMKSASAVVEDESAQPVATMKELAATGTAIPPITGGKKYSSDSSMNPDYLDDFISSEIFSPLLRLSPPPSDRDYYFNLDDTEGLCDLFDVPMLRM